MIMYKFEIAQISKILFIMSAVLLSSCVQVNAPQLSSLYQMMVPPADPLDVHRWDLQVGQYKTQVYLLNIDGQSVFANGNKDILVLQDNTLVDIILPALTDVHINVSDTPNNQQDIIRTINVNDTLFETQKCTKWITSDVIDNSNQVVSFVSFAHSSASINTTQSVLSCHGATSQTQTLIYIDGTMQHISQYIPYIDKQIRLTKVSTR